MELNQIEIFIFAIVWAAVFAGIVWLFGERRNVTEIKYVYEIRPRRDRRGVAAISDALSFIIALIVEGDKSVSQSRPRT